ncbi:hypothetical protein NMY22_g10965 [Coprinellus aureogranulatus]|nr:hypothetical protein NMY22_g10965 [Coprinellus aureogranulatus]
MKKRMNPLPSRPSPSTQTKTKAAVVSGIRAQHSLSAHRRNSRSSRQSHPSADAIDLTLEEDIDEDLSRLLSARASLNASTILSASANTSTNASTSMNMSTAYSSSANITKDSLFSSDSEEEEDEVSAIIAPSS